MTSFIRQISLLALCALLGACTTVKLTYNHADTVLYWWLDGYIDFTVDQKIEVKNDIQTFHQWHRQTQLPVFVALSQTLQTQALSNVTAVQLCAQWDRLAPTLLPPISAYLEPSLARLAVQLSADQVTFIENKYAKTNKKWLEEWQPKTTRELHKHAEKMVLERVENLYKKLSDAQLHMLREHIAASPFDAKIAYAERLRRQQDLLAVLKNIQSKKISVDAAKEPLRALLERTVTPTDSSYRAYAERVRKSNCEMYAALHNSTTPEQRSYALQALKSYELDFKNLQTIQ